MPETTLNPSATTDVRPATPTEEMSGNGTPKGVRTALPSSIMDSIRAAATKNLPASDVAPTTTAPANESKPAPAATADVKAAAPATPAKAADATSAAKPAPTEAKADADSKPAKKDGIAAVREALERAEARAKELENSYTATSKEKADAFAKVAEFEGKLKGWQERYEKEFEPQIKKLTEREKRLQEVEEQLRIRDYTATPEWHEKYVKPIVDVQHEAASVLQELAVMDENGNTRAATLDDFNKIHSAPSLNAAEAMARKLFGDGFATTELVRHSSRLRSLVRTQSEALKKAQVESADYFKRQQDEHLAAQSRFKQRVQERVAQYAVKPVEGDAEEAAAAARGQEWAEQVERGSTDPEQWSDMVAKVKATVASDGLKELRLKRMSEELAGLRAELKRYQANEPDVAGSGKGAPPADGEQTGGPLPKSNLTQHLLSVARNAARQRGAI